MSAANRSGHPSSPAVLALGALCLSLGILVGCSSDDQVKPLKPLQVATGNWEPFVGEHLPHNGPLAEMVTTILGDFGYAPEFQFYDWPMVEKQLERGYPALAFPFIESEERKNERGFVFSEPLQVVDYVLFYHKDREAEFSSISSMQDIVDRELKIGRIRGYAKLSAIQGEENYIEAPSAVSGFKMLRRNKHDDGLGGKKIDFLLESRIVGQDILEGEHIDHDKDDFMYLGQAGPTGLISKVNLCIMLSAKLDKDVTAAINESINSPKNREFFENLREKTAHSRPETALLSAPRGKLIYGYARESSDAEVIVIPQNSRVLIMKWGNVYTAANNRVMEDVDPGVSQVKLLNGPLKGKVMWVSGRNITLER